MFKILIRCWDTRVQSYLTSACKIFDVARKRRVPAEKCYRSIKKDKRIICLKQKHWSKKWVLGTSNRCPAHFSRQFLTTDSTFPYSSKNSSAEHILALSTWLAITNKLTHIDNTHTFTHSLTNAHTHTNSLTLTHTGICLRYGKVESVVRNCLLKWSGHLFEVPSTHLFDQCFCFKHISHLYAPIGAFFRWC